MGGPGEAHGGAQEGSRPARGDTQSPRGFGCARLSCFNAVELLSRPSQSLGRWVCGERAAAESLTPYMTQLPTRAEPSLCARQAVSGPVAAPAVMVSLSSSWLVPTRSVLPTVLGSGDHQHPVPQRRSQSLGQRGCCPGDAALAVLASSGGTGSRGPCLRELTSGWAAVSLSLGIS